MIASVSAEADRELTEGALYYAKQAGSEVALAFISEYERVVTLVCANPQIGAVWRNGRRRFPVRKFPYSVVYYLRGDEVRIVALAHHRRRPAYWKSRA